MNKEIATHPLLEEKNFLDDLANFESAKFNVVPFSLCLYERVKPSFR